MILLSPYSTPLNVLLAFSSRAQVGDFFDNTYLEIVLTSHRFLGKGVLSATFNPDGYEKAITESLCAIKSEGEHLIYQADMSAKYETDNGLQMVLDRRLSDSMVFYYKCVFMKA